MRPGFAAFLIILLLAGLARAAKGGHAEYMGGTIAKIPQGCSGVVEATDEHFFIFESGKASWRVPYERVNLLEYGQQANRRVVAAILISPLFLLSKKRQHFLTVGYEDDEGHQQAMIFRVKPDSIRAVLVSLEARTGRRVEYQDDEARRSGTQ